MAIQSDRLEELNMFMFDTMASAEMAVDWYCDRFNVSATDEVIDFVLDAHEAFFGEADQSYLNSVMLDDWQGGTASVVPCLISCIVYTSQTTNDSHA